MRTVDFLIEHMNNYNNTVVIFGQDVLRNTIGSIEDVKKDWFNRKTLIKENDKFWDNFKDAFSTGIEDSVSHHVFNGIECRIYDQSINFDLEKYNHIPLNGHIEENKCHSCGNLVEMNSAIKNKICECGKPIMPTVLTGMKRHKDLENSLQRDILSCNTLFLIEADLTDALLQDTVKRFIEMKKDQGENTKWVLVVIEEENPEIPIESLGFAEFIVRGDVEESINRFYESFTK